MQFFNVTLAIILYLNFNVLAFANQCPRLEGKYYCQTSMPNVSKLMIKQKQDSREITTYGFLYPEISKEADFVQASDSGIPDGFGWIVYCKQNKLVSISTDGLRKSEIFIDRNGHYVSYLNDQLSMRCNSSRP